MAYQLWPTWALVHPCVCVHDRGYVPRLDCRAKCEQKYTYGLYSYGLYSYTRCNYGLPGLDCLAECEQRFEADIARLYTQMGTPPCVRTHIHTCLSTCLFDVSDIEDVKKPLLRRLYVHTHIHTRARTRARTHTQTHTCTHTCTHMHTHAHTCTCTCTHTCTHTQRTSTGGVDWPEAVEASLIGTLYGAVDRHVDRHVYGYSSQVGTLYGDE